VSGERPELSVVVPAHDEAGNVAPLCEAIEAALAGIDWECLLVDDESRDSTRAEMLEARGRQTRFRVIAKSGWKGKSSSLLAGFERARGRLIGTIDADLQDDPADLVRAMKALEEQRADAVNGWRQRRDDSLVKRVSSRIGNGVRRGLLGSSIRDAGTGIRVFRRECLDALVPFEGVHRYFAELLELRGFRVVEIPVAHRSRHAGVAKYGVGNRLFRGIADVLAVRWLQRRLARHRTEEIEK
jgi:glycosyltransferase involved in cell wall biosynthesis